MSEFMIMDIGPSSAFGYHHTRQVYEFARNEIKKVWDKLKESENNLKEALNLTELALKEEPFKTDKSYRVNMVGLQGDTLFRMGNHKSALEYFEKANELDPLPEYTHAIARIYASREEYDKAIEKLLQISHIEDNITPHLLVLYYNRIGEYNKAEEFCKEAMQKISKGSVEPGKTITQKHLEDILDNLDKELLLNVQNNLGVAYMKRNEFDKALKCFNNVKELGRINPTLYNIACVRALQKEPEEEVYILLDKFPPEMVVNAGKDEDFMAYWDKEGFKRRIQEAEKKLVG